MKATMINKTHIEGLLYEHDLALKTSGPNSKTPGTEFISGTVSIATDNACVNIVPVHFTYVTATTAKGGVNATFTTLKNIIDGALKSVMKDGKDVAAKVRIDSAIGLNEFFAPNRQTGEDELVSAKRNEGGFVHLADALAEDENTRNTFETDMVITGVRRIEADPEKGTAEKGIIKGYIFDFRKAIMPVEYTILKPSAIDYFESAGASPNTPFFTKVWGQQVSETVVKRTVVESAFGDDEVRETKSTRKDFVVTNASKYPYEWDDESSITADELKKAMADRELYVATIKQRQDEYKASKNTITPAPAIAAKPATFNF